MYFLAYKAGFVSCSFFFFFNDTATTEIYTLSLHDALPFCAVNVWPTVGVPVIVGGAVLPGAARSEEHTSELQSLTNLVCRLLLEKKNKEQSLTKARKKKKKNIQ